MKLEQQVCSLELAKKLKELGVQQNSVFNYKTYWIDNHNPKIPEIQYNPSCKEPNKGSTFTNLQFVSAFTVAELGEMLPDDYSASYKSGAKWAIYDHAESIDEDVKYIESETEADARAKMLIYLLENKLIHPTQGDNK